MRRSKQELCAAVQALQLQYGAPLYVAETFADTPILTLYCGSKAGIHLQRHLMRVGIMTVSCETYEGLDSSAVRLMLPDRQYMPLLLELTEQAVRLL